MLSYLEKYNKLPAEMRSRMSAPEIVDAIGRLEKQYGINLATAVMRVMVKELSLVDLPQYFAFEYELGPHQAEALVEELKDQVLVDFAGYLGYTSNRKEPAAETAVSGGGKPKNRPDTRVSAAPIRSSNFFFSSEDEEEVRELTEKLYSGGIEQREKSMKNDQELNSLTDSIVNELHFNFSSEDLAHRFRQVVYTCVKGVRNRLDTKETLKKAIATGGLGLNEPLSNKTIAVVDRMMMERHNDRHKVDNGMKPENNDMGKLKAAAGKAEQVNSHLNIISNTREKSDIEKTSASAIERDAPYDFSRLAESPPAAGKTSKAAESPRPAEKHVLDLASAKQPASDHGKQAGASPLKSDVIDLSRRSSADKRDEKTDPEKGILFGKEKVIITQGAAAGSGKAKQFIRQAPTQSGKVRVEDVKYVPKLTGPIDELKEMDLINFRRLSADADTATGKIKEKISFLEEGSYQERLAGIKAWRLSPVNKLYLAIGQESIHSQRPIDEIIQDRKENGGEYLTKPEFAAIMELNRGLRF